MTNSIYVKYWIKNLIKRLFGRFRFYQKLIIKRKNIDKEVIFLNKSKYYQFSEMLDKIVINLDDNNCFAHWIDERLYLFNIKTVVGNMSPDYSLILDNSIEDLIDQEKSIGTGISKKNVFLLSSIKRYIERVIGQFDCFTLNDNVLRKKIAFQHMINGKTENLFEALQRILFWSSLFWQSDHKLIGLGRLDKIIDSYYSHNEESVELLKNFFLELHRFYSYKSNAILGDIGQICILGGVDVDGSYFCNDCTYDSLVVLKEIHISDPKILLRVSQKMPNDLLKCAVECIQSGCGSPLLSNDDVIICSLIDFGYEKQDAYNYVVSACWEPASYGNSLEQNNLENIEFTKVFSNLLTSDDIVKCTSFEELLNMYLQLLQSHIVNKLKLVDSIIFEEDPLFTLFVRNCSYSNLDIAKGGAKYNNYGVLSVGLGNTINSLLNINDRVFIRHETDLFHVRQSALDNTPESLSVYQYVFGNDSNDVIELTNYVISYVNESLYKYKNKFGGKIKWGLSSPSYISSAVDTGVSYDGRKSGEPLDVHISSRKALAYTELIKFASQIKYYGSNSNGNVLDLIVSPTLISDSIINFQYLIFSGIKLGFFQMQMNVVDSKTLIAAKNNPEMYPNLIVRVWGFSAYFNDLPNDYKNVLIERTMLNEELS